MRAHLTTVDDDHVENVWLPTGVWPEVVSWGNRHFRFECLMDGHAVYVECSILRDPPLWQAA